MCIFVKVLIYMNKDSEWSLSVFFKALISLIRALKKNKGKAQLGNPKSGRGRLWERSLARAFHYEV